MSEQDSYWEESAVTKVLQQTATLLDMEDFEGWLSLFAEESEYEISAYSPEIRCQMSWWKSGKKSLELTVREIKKHVKDLSARTHVVSPTRIQLTGERANATSTFALFRTSVEGASNLYVVGRYEDTLLKVDGSWRYTVHRVMLQTRMLEAPTHVPI